MTDILTRAGVLAPVWEAPPDEGLSTLIAKFGVEYEMFPRGYDDDDEYCDCGDEGCTPRPASVPASDEPRVRLAQLAHSRGLTSTVDRHEYHCSCSTCAYDRAGPLMTTQADSSVGVEFVSRILNVNVPADLDDVEQWVDMMTHWKNRGGWMPDGHANCGNHIHIERHSTYLSDEKVINFLRLPQVAFDWTNVADGGCGRIRDYNEKPSTGYSGGWLAVKRSTWEHRQWNTPRDPQRLWAHIGLSVALTRWAYHAAQHLTWTLDRYKDYGGFPITGAVADISKNADLFKQQVAFHLPDDKRFAVAAEVLQNLKTY